MASPEHFIAVYGGESRSGGGNVKEKQKTRDDEERRHAGRAEISADEIDNGVRRVRETVRNPFRWIGVNKDNAKNQEKLGVIQNFELQSVRQ